MNMNKLVKYIIVLGGTLIAILAAGCSEKDVPFVIDADEITAYITNSHEAIELFSVAGFYPEQPYEVAHLDATFQDRLLEHKRTMYVETIPLKTLDYGSTDSSKTPDSILYADYGSLGKLREAWVVINDEFTIETIRSYAADTLVDTTDRTLQRYAFFIKLGNDSKDYVGWLLWGYRGMYNGNPPLRSVMFARVDGEVTEIEGDVLMYNDLPLSNPNWFSRIGFIKLSDIPKIDNGEPIALETHWIGSTNITKRDYPLITFDGQAGFTTIAARQDSREEYRGVADLRDGSTRRYNSLLLQAFHDDEFFHIVSWTVPYQL